MKLAILEAPEAPQLAASDFEFPLPLGLRHPGEAGRARLSGNRRGPLLVVLGGISANRFVCPDLGDGWWRGLVGSGCALDPAVHAILGVDFAADPSGRSAPSTHDQALVVCAALDAIGADKADAIVGASYGGMVALSLAEHFPERVGKLIVVSSGSEPHPSATAIRDLQRRVVALGLENGKGDEALSIARGMAMLTYRTPEEFAGRFAGGLASPAPLGPSEPGAYLRARGDAFPTIMSPERFLSLSASIDRHRVDPGAISATTLLIGATSDQLVPPGQMRDLHARLGGPSGFHLLDSLFGHDMFLKEAARLGDLITPFLEA